MFGGYQVRRGACPYPRVGISPPAVGQCNPVFFLTPRQRDISASRSSVLQPDHESPLPPGLASPSLRKSSRLLSLVPDQNAPSHQSTLPENYFPSRECRSLPI